MDPGRQRSSRRLRSTLDRVLIHDIKNMGFRLELVLANLEEHYGDPDFKRSLQDLLSSTIERLDRVVGRWSATEDPVLIKVSLDLNGVLREVAQSSPRRAGGRGARLPQLRTALGALPPVWGDPYYLRDAFQSLIENAVEAAAPEGRVVVRSFPMGNGRRSRAVVEIIDNGSGMSPEFLRESLFQPFATTKPNGVGLGLFTAAQIVRFHRGTMRVSSQPGGGTVVRLAFPAASGS